MSKTGTKKRTRRRKRRSSFSVRIRKLLFRILRTTQGKCACCLLVLFLVILCVSGVRSMMFSYKVHHLSIEKLQECADKQEYLDTVTPIYKKYCHQYHIKYPGILALQAYYEVGSDFPHNLSEVAIADNNLGGLKYAEGIPRATIGSECPENEGGNYCHFESVGDYIHAQCWQVGQELYDYVRAHQSSVEEFSRALSNMWIGGFEDCEPFGYSESLIDDYQGFQLKKYEN